MKFSDDANLQNVFLKFLFRMKELREATFTISFAIPISCLFFKIFFTLLTSRKKKKGKNRLVQFKETKNCANTYISNVHRTTYSFLNIDKQEQAAEKSKTRGTNNVLSSSVQIYFACMYILAINRLLLEPRKIEIFAGDAISTNDSFALCVYDRRENAFYDWTAYSAGSNCNCTYEHERKRGWQLA